MILLFLLAACCTAGSVTTYLQMAGERRKRRALQHTNGWLEQERLILNLIAQGTPLNQTLDALAAAAEETCPGSWCSIFLLDQRKRVRIGAGGSLPQPYLQRFCEILMVPEVAFLKQIVVAESIAINPSWAALKELPLEFGLRACWSIPLRDSAGAVLGVFALYRKEPAAPQAEDLRMLELGAQLAGYAVMRQAAEQRALETSEHVRIAETVAKFGLWECDPETGEYLLSAGAAEICQLGSQALRISAAELNATAHPEDHAGIMDARERAFSEGGRYQHEFRRLFADGSIRWFSNHGFVELANGLPKRVIGFVIDITQQKELQEHLSAGVARMKWAEEAAGFGVCDHDITTDRVTLTEGALRFFGLPPDSPLTLQVNELRSHINTEDFERVEQAVDTAIRERTAIRVETRLLQADGNIIWHLVLGRVEYCGPHPVRVIIVAIDITREKEIFDQLRATAERMRLAENAAGFGVWEFDYSSRLFRFSEGMSLLQGQPLGTTLQCSYQEFAKGLSAEDLAALQAAHRDCVQTRQPCQVEHQVTLPDGAVQWRRTHARAMFHGDVPTGLIGATRDISEEKETLLRLEKALSAAEDAARAKSEFLASMSHEIRTPMNGVIGMTGLLLDSPLTELQREYAETVRSSSEALLAIINDILDFSKIEAGKLTIHADSFDLRLLLEEVVDMVSPRAQEKQLDLMLEYPLTIPAHFIGDGDRIRQVLTNLLGNAVKFTESGHVLTAVTCQINEFGTARVAVSVADTGIGIAPEKVGLLFDKFSQADSSITRRYGGTGLGLAICKKLATLMGGGITLESVEGQGSTFTFALDLPVDPQPVTFSGEALLQGLRTLIVDDIEVNRRILREQISGSGMRPSAAASGAEALEALRGARAAGDPFRIVLADYQMPEMDGGTLAARIRAEFQDDAAGGEPLILLLSSVGLRPDTSANVFLAKPVRRVRLLNALTSAWAKQHPAAEGASVEPVSISAAKSMNALAQHLIPTFHRSSSRVLVVEDNPVNQRVALRLLERIGVRADIAGNGREALELLQHLPYDVVLMDCQMPEMDGYEAAACVRKMDGPNRNVRIIALTADVLAGSRERCLAAGMDDFLSKPVQLDDLIQKLGDRLVPQTQGSQA